MQTDSETRISPAAVQLLLELGIPAHRVGYEQLCVALPHFARDKQQCLSTELYPFVAERLRYSDWRAVEHAIREVIACGWKHRDPAVWSRYFPGFRRAPSNKRFIATLAEYIP